MTIRRCNYITNRTDLDGLRLLTCIVSDAVCLSVWRFYVSSSRRLHWHCSSKSLNNESLQVVTSGTVVAECQQTVVVRMVDGDAFHHFFEQTALIVCSKKLHSQLIRRFNLIVRPPTMHGQHEGVLRGSAESTAVDGVEKRRHAVVTRFIDLQLFVFV